MSVKTVFLSILIFLPLITSAHSTVNEVIVEISEAGFSPAEIVIEPHTTVVFKNVGIENHWPATDAHPSHTHFDGTDLETHCAEDYTETTFDSCSGIEPGESWSFNFEEIGTFKYHDHLWAHLGGIIEVQTKQVVQQKTNIEVLFEKIRNFFANLFRKNQPQPEEPNLISRSATDKNQYESLKAELTQLVTDQDPGVAIQTLEAMGSEDTQAGTLCHDLLHQIGRAAIQKYGDFSSAVRYQSDYCNSGYIHGLFEELFATQDIDLQGIRALCNEYASTGRPLDIWQCYHGTGHGLMYLNGGDLTTTLDQCRGLTGYATSQCYNGAFMEVFNNELLAKESDFIDPDNPYTLCEETTAGKNDCYLYAPTYYTQNLDFTHEETLKTCEAVNSLHQNTCIKGVSSEAAKRNLNALADVYALCDDFSDAKQAACREGIATITVFQTASLEKATALCEEAPTTYQEQCRADVHNAKGLFE